jgi:regulator of sigma E protease
MINILSNTAAFVFALGVIIFVHEAGHLVAAKYFNVRTLTFSLGFGKRLWGFKRGETDYRVSLVPLGGYVQLSGEDPTEASEDPRDFLNKPRWQRIIVYLAGPIMNVLLAIVLIAVVFMVGLEVVVSPEISSVVGRVAEGWPGEEAGLEPGDRITSIDGQEVSKWEEVRFEFLTAPDRPLQVEYERDGVANSTVLTPRKVPTYEIGEAGVFPDLLPRILGLAKGAPAEEAGFERGDEVRKVDGRAVGDTDEFVAYVSERAGVPVEVEVQRDQELLTLTVVPRDEGGVGRIGVSIGAVAYQRYGVVEAFRQSVAFNMDITRQTFQVLGKIFSGKLAAKSALSGPIEIAAMSGAAVRSGFRNLLYLMGVISISIAILNLLPIPVLDGGQIFILLVESLRRRDLSLGLKERINQLGFLMIVMLMIVVLYFDLVKNVPAGLLPGS